LSIQGKIYGVSLGPGDPELITLKGWKTLQQVDKIYYPASLQEGVVRSYSLSILEQYALQDKILQPVILEMSHNREYNLKAYTKAFDEIRADVENGLQVAFVSEGDISFYSTFIYILEQIRAHQLPLEIIAGVPSFLLATAAHQQPLALLQEKIAIIPLLKSREVLEDHLQKFETVVLIKVRGALAYIAPLIAANKAVMLYGEKLGTPAQYLSNTISSLETRDLPYFSLVILKSNICA
jgi:precorrin-2/cobalt-factor-2 C20-methyltransferase